jgi:hypothetical protein
VDPVPDPLLLRKSGSTRNRPQTSGSVVRNSDHWTTEAVVQHVTAVENMGHLKKGTSYALFADTEITTFCIENTDVYSVNFISKSVSPNTSHFHLPIFTFDLMAIQH